MIIKQPYVNFILPYAGGNVKPISNGTIYIGKEGLDQKLGGNPIYYRDNEGTEVEISSPLYLNATGVIVDGPNSSNIINPYTKAPISILVLNKNGDPVWDQLRDVSTFISAETVGDYGLLKFSNVQEMENSDMSVGQRCSTGATQWERISTTNNDITDFVNLSPIVARDFYKDSDLQAITDAIAASNGTFFIDSHMTLSGVAVISGFESPKVSFVGAGKITTSTPFTFDSVGRGVLTFINCSNPTVEFPEITGSRETNPAAPEPHQDGDAGIHYQGCTGLCKTVNPVLSDFKTWGIIHVNCDDYVVLNPVISDCMVQSGIGGTSLKNGKVVNPDIRRIGLYGIELESTVTLESAIVTAGEIRDCQKALQVYGNVNRSRAVGVTATNCLFGFSASAGAQAQYLCNRWEFTDCKAMDTSRGYEQVFSSRGTIKGCMTQNVNQTSFTRTRALDFIPKVDGTTAYFFDGGGTQIAVGDVIRLDSPTGAEYTVQTVGSSVSDSTLNAQIVPFTTNPIVNDDFMKAAIFRQFTTGVSSVDVHGGKENTIEDNDFRDVTDCLNSFGFPDLLSVKDNSYRNVTNLLNTETPGDLTNSSVSIKPSDCRNVTNLLSSSAASWLNSLNERQTFSMQYDLSDITDRRVTLGKGHVCRVEVRLNDGVTFNGNGVFQVNNVDEISNFANGYGEGFMNTEVSERDGLNVKLLDSGGTPSGTGYVVTFFGGFIEN
jgi:hypothetical protein